MYALRSSHENPIEQYGPAEQKNASLASQKRWTKRMGTTVLLLATGVAVMGQAPPSERSLEADRIVLRDANGKRRMMLYVSEGFGTSLVIRDMNGKILGRLSEGNDGPELDLVNRDGDIQATMTASIDGAALKLTGQNGTRCADLFVPTKGIGPELKLKDGGAGITLCVDDGNAGPMMKFERKDGKQLRLKMDQDGSPLFESVKDGHVTVWRP